MAPDELEQLRNSLTNVYTALEAEDKKLGQEAFAAIKTVVADVRAALAKESNELQQTEKKQATQQIQNQEGLRERRVANVLMNAAQTLDPTMAQMAASVVGKGGLFRQALQTFSNALSTAVNTVKQTLGMTTTPTSTTDTQRQAPTPFNTKSFTPNRND